MNKSSSTKFSLFIALALVFGVFAVHGQIYAKPADDKTTVTRDSTTLLLEGKTLPKGDYIELYDATPYKIATGHFVAKVPCNPKGNSEVQLLTGVAPDFKSNPAELIKVLSTPGKLCLYHVDLVSEGKNIITDVAIKNNSTHGITFPPTSSVAVGVDEIAPLPPGMG
ncbi:MAG TPA: hypothetical protein VIY08_11280 [Candidatus Nitrosocosmicus sp.]